MPVSDARFTPHGLDPPGHRRLTAIRRLTLGALPGARRSCIDEADAAFWERCANRIDTRVGDSAVTQIEHLQIGQAPELVQPRVGDPAAIKVQLAKLGK